MISYTVQVRFDDQALYRAVGQTGRIVSYSVGERALAIIANRTPVKTGDLKRSLRHIQTTDEAGLPEEWIVAGMFYAIYVDKGTRFMAPRYFMSGPLGQLTR